MEVKGVKIEYTGHDGFLITGEGGKTIAIDPYNVSDHVPKADYILITHSHYDHCSIKDIQKLAKEGTTIVIPADAQSKITRVEKVDMQVVEPGEEIQMGSVKVETVPAYNVDKEFHTKSEGWMGYIIKFKDVVIYHAGDTDRIPEMQRLTGYGKKGQEFVTLLPVSGTYVMDAEQAASVASLLSPTVAVPMHYGAGVVGTHDDAKRFVELCKEKNVHAKILEKI